MCYPYGVSIPRALLLALALLQAVGVTDYLRRAACEEECKTDGCDDLGLGDCCACHCPGAPQMTAPVIAVVDVPPASVAARAVFAQPDDVRANPDPREILHVPRSVFV